MSYRIHYRVRADYEHFLRAVKEEKAVCRHIRVTVTSYAGEGFSESKENKKLSKKEHREITKKYLGNKVYLYRLMMVLTLQPLREKMAGSEKWSGLYHKLKGMIYKK